MNVSAKTDSLKVLKRLKTAHQCGDWWLLCRFWSQPTLVTFIAKWRERCRFCDDIRARNSTLIRRRRWEKCSTPTQSKSGRADSDCLTYWLILYAFGHVGPVVACSIRDRMSHVRIPKRTLVVVAKLSIRHWLGSLVYGRARVPSSRPSHGTHWHGPTQPTTWTQV